MNFNCILRIFPSHNAAYKLEKFFAENIEQEKVQLELIEAIKNGKVEFVNLGDAQIGIREERYYSKFRFIKQWTERTIVKFGYLSIGKDIHSGTSLKYGSEIYQAIQEQIKKQSQ